MSKIKYYNTKPLKGNFQEASPVSFTNVDLIANAGSSIDSLSFPGNGVIQSSDSNGIVLESAVGITSEYYIGERINISSTFISPSADTSQTFINLSGGINVSGNLSNSIFDFFIKGIIVTECSSGSSISFLFPSGKLTTPDGNVSAKTITLNAIGQGFTLIWDNVIGTWYLKDGGIYTLS